MSVYALLTQKHTGQSTDIKKNKKPSSLSYMFASYNTLRKGGKIVIANQNMEFSIAQKGIY